MFTRLKALKTSTIKLSLTFSTTRTIPGDSEVECLKALTSVNVAPQVSNLSKVWKRKANFPSGESE